MAPHADTWWDWKQDQEAETEPLIKQENEAAKEESPIEITVRMTRKMRNMAQPDQTLFHIEDG
ncbi:hypothetical protein [Bacillus sonorensis]|uniref:Uncharacterized protein n=1 Tax=Bacillus sonorensis L12 TaxID=1274524 RepID=M5PCW1_9BACI|nr:hypothetical protein [Bacillus sonorensis]EME74190.1 hypothetical protein BSONL12_10391 [Bacillus sonorensis L12]TWK72083.1 hypothetical protein CHCC20335_2779 [Bacillus paralicheniformis]